MAGTCIGIPRRTFLVRLAAVVAALLVALAALWHPLVASAAPVGFIMLDCRVNGMPLAGDTYGLVCVADVIYDANAGVITSYQTRDAFAFFDYDWSNMKSSELDEAAKALASHAGEKSLYAHTAVSDASGCVGFWGLEPGFYLVSRIATADANAGYACDPLLITVPLADDGQLVWSVTSQPKFGEPGSNNPNGPDESGPDEPDNPTLPEEPDVPESPGTPDITWSWLANTGDVALMGIGALLVLGGATVVLAGVIGSRSKVDPAEAVPGDDADSPE